MIKEEEIYEKFYALIMSDDGLANQMFLAKMYLKKGDYSTGIISKQKLNDTVVKTEFISNLVSRHSFSLKYNADNYIDDNYHLWSISCTEYYRVSQLINLESSYLSFIKLASYQ